MMGAIAERRDLEVDVMLDVEDLPADDDVVLSGRDAALVIRGLTARVRQLETMLAQQQFDGERLPARLMPELVSVLRRQGVILLALNEQSLTLAQQSVASSCASTSLRDAASEAMRRVWMLDRAPLPIEVIAQVRAAVDDGASRW